MEAVILIGHGGVAADTPRELVRELKAMEGKRHARGGPMCEREQELDGLVRRWPRTPETDPYQEGLEQIADALRPKLGGRPSPTTNSVYQASTRRSTISWPRALPAFGWSPPW